MFAHTIMISLFALRTLFAGLIFLAIPLEIAFAQNAGQIVSPEQYSSTNRSLSAPIVTTSPLSDLMETNYRYNSSPHQQSNLATAFDVNANHWWQYLVYWDENRQAHITRRNFSNHGGWQNPINIHAALGGDRLEDDSHNTIAVGIDNEGYIHVAGNHHSDPLNYAISNAPHSLSRFTNRPSMISSDARNSEGRVTYPTFFNTVDGELMFFYRNQTVSPSVFASYLNRWDQQSRQWRRVAKLAQGRDLRFYHQRIAVDNTSGPNRGRIHIMAMWRNDAGSGSGVTNNEDLFHLYSDNAGESWFQYGAAGAASLPLSLGNVDDLIVNSRPHPNSRRFSNQSGLELDSNGNPHALVSMSDQAGSSSRYYFHIWYDGNSWITNRLTTFRPGTRSAIVTTDGGEVFGMFTRLIGGSSRLVLLNLTPGASGYDNEVITLTVGMTDEGSAPNYDAGALYHHNRLSFLAVRGPLEPSGSNVNHLQDGTIVSVDLNQINALRNAPFLSPALERIFTDSSSADVEINGGNIQRIYATSSRISSDTLGRALSAKIVVDARMLGSGTGVVSLRYPSGNRSLTAGRLAYNGSNNRSASTTLLPLLNHTSGSVEVVGVVNGGTGSLVINSVSIEVYRANAQPFPQNEAINISPPMVQVQSQATEVISDPVSQPCIDEDGDGWGWNGITSCLVGSASGDSVVSEPGICVDEDGDGWGWNGSSSCLLDTGSNGSTVTAPVVLPATCVDEDGDGWGWDGVMSCRP